MMQNNY